MGSAVDVTSEGRSVCFVSSANPVSLASSLLLESFTAQCLTHVLARKQSTIRRGEEGMHTKSFV